MSLGTKVDINAQTTGTLSSNRVANGGQLPVGVDIGVADAYVVNLSPAISSYTLGFSFEMRILNTNSGAACTINVNSVGVVGLKKNNNTDPSAADLPANGMVALTFQGTYFVIASQIVSTAPSGSASGSLGGSYPSPTIAKLTDIPLVKVSHTVAAGTDGGSFTSGSWQTHPLNVKDNDTGSICTLAANQFALPAGTYDIDWFMVGFNVDGFQSRIRNITDSSTALIGSLQYCSNAGGQLTSILSHGTGRIVIAGSKTFELQGQCEATKATDGFGPGRNFGESNVYAVVIMRKVA